MPRVLITYFSQSGTTARVARRIAAGLEVAGHTVQTHNLSRATADHSPPPRLADVDLLGVGSPAHYYRLATPVSDFLANAARECPAIPAFGFLLYGAYSGWAGGILGRTLAARSGGCLGLFSCRGADRYLGYLRRGFLFSAGHPTAGELAAAQTFGEAIGHRARAGGDLRPARPTGPSTADRMDDPTGYAADEIADEIAHEIAERPLDWVYRMERALSAPFVSRHVYSRLFRVDAGRCTSCGACVRRCPRGNVTLSSRGLPTWGRDCLFCLYCQMICTEEAISSPVSWPPFEVLTSHNVKEAAADPGLDHALVDHSRGRTRIR